MYSDKDNLIKATSFIEITIDIEEESQRVLNEYCKRENISPSEAVERGIRRMAMAEPNRNHK